MVPGSYVISHGSEVGVAKNIFLVDSVDEDTMVVIPTINCVPMGQKTRVSIVSGGNKWEDVSDLVLEANAAILPQGLADFESETAAVYRNVVDLSKYTPLSGEQAENKICLLAVDKGGKRRLSKSGRFVSGCKDGLCAVYDRFCERSKEHTLNIMDMTGMYLYDAEPIVAECNEMLQSDRQKADEYTASLQESVMKSTDYEMAPELSRMSMGV